MVFNTHTDNIGVIGVVAIPTGLLALAFSKTFIDKTIA
jgi:hypothetical protein